MHRRTAALLNGLVACFVSLSAACAADDAPSNATSTGRLLATKRSRVPSVSRRLDGDRSR